MSAPVLAVVPAVIPAVIPSPTTGVWYLGPIPIRAYALAILTGIVVAVWITQRRLDGRGGKPGQVLDISAWAVPFGIVGGRVYHLITSPQAYFGPGGQPLNAFKIWEGGLGIWGAVALGALGAYIGCRRHGVPFLDFVDAAAPGVLVAQALGRWGNYFNNEIYGAPTDLPWGLKVYQWDQGAGHAVTDANGNPIVLGIFQPTFLYESVFCLVLAAVLVALDRRFDLRPGQVFGLYVAGYPLGRVVIELMRTDEANRILGLRVNVWVSMLVFLLGVGIFVWAGRRPATSSRRRRAATEDDTQGAADADDTQGAADADDAEGTPTVDEPQRAPTAPDGRGA